MKVSQTQYFEIEEFLIEKCRLFETEFIEEMTDHFIDSIEAKLSESIPFDQAFSLTIRDFGGLASIQKMEWQYRKGCVKKQFRILWILLKNQFSGLKLLRTATISVSITAICIYLGLYSKDMTESYDFVNGILSGAGIIPASILPIFLLQRYVKWMDIFGGIKSQTAVRVSVNYLLLVVTALLSVGISKSDFTDLSSAILQSALWTALAISYISLIEYSQKYEEKYWFTTK